MYGGAQSVLVTEKSFFINLLCCRFYLLTYCRLTRIMSAFFAGRSSVPWREAALSGTTAGSRGQQKYLSPPLPPSASLLIFFLFPSFFLFSSFFHPFLLFFFSSFLISLPFFSFLFPPFLSSFKGFFNNKPGYCKSNFKGHVFRSDFSTSSFEFRARV